MPKWLVPKHHDTEKARAALQLIHRNALGEIREVYMSIPPNMDRDADLILSAVIDERDRLRELVRCALPLLQRVSETYGYEKLAAEMLAEMELHG